MVLNKNKKTDNTTNCERMKAGIGYKGSMSVVKCIIADCSDADEVQDIVLKEVLDYLVNHIENLDRQFAEACQDRIFSMQREVQTVLEEAKKALDGSSLNIEDSRLEVSQVFKGLFKERWDALTTGLERLVKTLRNVRSLQHPLFHEYVRNAFEKCDNDPMPSLQDIEIKRDSLGGYDNAYGVYLDEVRTRLTHNFFSLDDALRTVNEEAKGKVANVLVQDGYLGHLLVTGTDGQIVQAGNPSP